MNLREALDKIVKVELGEAYAQTAEKKVPLRHIDTALEDLRTVKHWIKQAVKSTAVLDMNSNVPQEKFIQQKLLTTLSHVEKVEADLNDIANFIHGS